MALQDNKTEGTATLLASEAHGDLVVPNFFVIGVVKGGTTSLYHYLEQHPSIFLPQIKETNHFAASDIRAEHFLHQYRLDVSLDLDAYIAGGMKEKVHIAHVNDPHHYQALFRNAGSALAIGEISNSYMVAPSAVSAIFQYNPKAKIVVILRNPVTRVWSQFLMNIREAKTNRASFMEELEYDTNRPYQGWGASHQYLKLGHYASQLRPYLEHFGKDRVKVLMYEEYRRSPQAVLSDLCRFLGVDPNFSFNFSEEANKASKPRVAWLNKWMIDSGVIQAAKSVIPKKHRQKLGKLLYTESGLPEIQPADVEFLVNHYRQEVDELARLLDINISAFWKEF